MTDLRKMGSSQWISHQHFSASHRITSPTPQATASGALCSQPVWLGCSSCWDRLPFVRAMEGRRDGVFRLSSWHLSYQLPAESGGNPHPKQRHQAGPVLRSWRKPVWAGEGVPVPLVAVPRKEQLWPGDSALGPEKMPTT